jgi:hypothetical protein
VTGLHRQIDRTSSPDKVPCRPGNVTFITHILRKSSYIQFVELHLRANVRCSIGAGTRRAGGL